MLPADDQVRVNWDGVTVDNNWLDTEAFKIGDLSITNKEVAQVSGATITLIVIIILICLFVSYRKRKRIVVEARRASEFVRRSTRKIRMSIKQKMGQPIDEFESNEPVDPNKLGADRN